MPVQIGDQTLPGTAAELRGQLAAGWRCVRFESCWSLLLFTVRQQSPVHLTDSWQARFWRGVRPSLRSLLLGPWGVPWGFVWTPWAIWVNLTGGVDVTENVLAALGPAEGE